ncbi:mycofactocin biosynthesis glycosyltransferase MftF [Tsukamurella sp. 8F]|uniref:mycofactocin biosynthesis glycosyltransferase MftF n=1 Tax=unclassified Tsukamurella TaxID=2633480 RepID=UPI0023B8E234|nr:MULTISPECIES: mycofactocin biosynthesis glycosyltransferase MftF [unclassified Tsukamurella]MDF0530175.1 mycofactocin biosynthesis glycosyltransferase MftF [Tsukamurella sp. 8J]MDF0586492.1 mycofactocin biosynthesis glycosyltransferase MftF [Tsukamurella sp. 8F]
MTPRLPDGFTVRIDSGARVLDGGRVLLGGAPLRLLRLREAGAIDGDGIVVCDAISAAVARRLLDAGLAHPDSSPDVRPPVTVVVPVKDNASGVVRVVDALRRDGVTDVIVVDDGSAVPLHIDGVRIIRHRRPRGPAAARNAGIDCADTEFVAVLDSDVVPRPGWLDRLLPAFSDPAVAMAAPRIVALSLGGTERSPVRRAIARYEHARSSLDLGRDPARIAAGTPVAYVPSAAMVLRRSMFDEVGGFDEQMHVGEDVDLCWRISAAGGRARYVPASRVAHDHRVNPWDWLRRKAFYGTSAAPLAVRHPGLVPPMAMSAATLVGVVGVAGVSGVGTLLAIGAQAYAARKVAAALDGVPHRAPLVARVVARGFAGGLRQVVSAAWRHYWPVALPAALVSRRMRRAVLAGALLDGVADWWEHRVPGGPGPLAHTVLLRLDDLAYGAGLWRGVLAARSPEALRPRITR